MNSLKTNLFFLEMTMAASPGSDERLDVIIKAEITDGTLRFCTTKIFAEGGGEARDLTTAEYEFAVGLVWDAELLVPDYFLTGIRIVTILKNDRKDGGDDFLVMGKYSPNAEGEYTDRITQFASFRDGKPARLYSDEKDDAVELLSECTLNIPDSYAD
jgi:hypothetical protein